MFSGVKILGNTRTLYFHTKTAFHWPMVLTRYRTKRTIFIFFNCRAYTRNSAEVEYSAAFSTIQFSPSESRDGIFNEFPDPNEEYKFKYVNVETSHSSKSFYSL